MPQSPARRGPFRTCLLILAGLLAGLSGAPCAAQPGLASPRSPMQAAAAQAPRTSAATVTLTIRRPGSATPVTAVTAGAPFQVVLRVEALDTFPGQGEELRVVLPLYRRFRMAPAPQGSFPDRPGYTRVTRDPGCVRLAFLHPDVCPPPPLASMHARFSVLFDRPLARGEALEVVYGDDEEGATLAQELAASPGVPGYKPFLCQRVSATGRPLEVLASATPEVLPAEAARLEVVAPSTVRPGESFDLRVAARDRFGNPAAGFDGKLEFRCDGPLKVPSPLRLVSRGRALVRAPGAVAKAEGVFRIEAFTTVRPVIRGRSNPVLARASGPGIYFGDLHIHSGEVSADAYGSMQDAFEWARDVAGLDFAAKSDHSDDLEPGHWARSRELAAKFDEPGRFAAFLGFEWTPARSWGHRSVVYPGDEGVAVSARYPAVDTPEKLWAAVARFGGMAIPHNPGAEPVDHHHYDWSRHNPELEPAVEIYSQWTPDRDQRTAQDTETNPQGVQRALSLGYRLGIVAGGDSHTAMAGRTGGLAAVVAERLDRASLLRALRARRSFGTSGPRILLDLRTADAEAGSVSHSTTGPVSFRMQAHGTGPLDRLELVRGWKGAPIPLPVAAAFPAEGREDVEFTWQDPAPLREAFYYLRLFQQGGGRAWSSPIWVKRPSAPPTSSDWSLLTTPAGWMAGAAQTPSNDTASLLAGAAGFELRTGFTRTGLVADQMAVEFFWAQSAPFELAPGRYRLRYRLTSLLPAHSGCLIVDETHVNAGYAELIRTTTEKPSCRVEREFTIRPHSGPVRLLLHFAAMSNAYRFEGLALEVAR